MPPLGLVRGRNARLDERKKETIKCAASNSFGIDSRFDLLLCVMKENSPAKLKAAKIIHPQSLPETSKT